MHPSGEMRSVSSWVLGHRVLGENTLGPHSGFDKLLDTLLQLETSVEVVVWKKSTTVVKIESRITRVSAGYRPNEPRAPTDRPTSPPQ